MRPAPPPAPVVRRVTTPILVSGIVAGAALVNGVIFGIDATLEHSNYEKQPNHAVGLAGERSSFIADVSFGVAALFGLTALALYMLPDEPPPANEPAKAAQPARVNWFASALKGEVLRF